MLLTLAMAETRSMILVVLIFFSHVDSVVDVCKETHFLSQCVSPTSSNIFFFREAGVFPLVIAVCGKKPCFKDNPRQNCYNPVLHGVLKLYIIFLLFRPMHAILFKQDCVPLTRLVLAIVLKIFLSCVRGCFLPFDTRAIS